MKTIGDRFDATPKKYPGWKTLADVFIIGVVLAKCVFLCHAAAATVNALFRKKWSRAKFTRFRAETLRSIVAMEACASAHNWGREAQSADHEVQLVPAANANPLFKRHKSDAGDAEAISKAALRPSMQFVSVKTADQQSQAMFFRPREMFVRQRTQTINAHRAYLTEFGIILRLGIRNPVAFAYETQGKASELPAMARSLAERLLEQISFISEWVTLLDIDIKAHAKSSRRAQLMQTMPGVGPMFTMAVEAFCPRRRTSKADVKLLHGWVSCRGSIRQAARTASDASKNGPTGCAAIAHHRRDARD